MVAAPALLPMVEYLPKTMRWARMREPSPPSSSSPAKTYLPLVAPNAYGNDRFARYWGRLNVNEDAGGFVGTAMLLAALLAVGARRRFPQEALALGIATGCLLLMAPGSPASHRLLLPLSLCLAYLGACTLERFQRGEVRRWPLLIVAAGLAALLAWGYLAHPDPSDPARLAIFRFGWLRWQLRFLALATLLLAVTASWRRPARSLAVAGVAAALLAELLLIHRTANPPMPRRLALPVNGPIAFLRKNLRDDRMAAFGRDFPPNLAALYGLADARIYNPMAPQAYVERIAPIIFAWWGEIPLFGAPGHPLYGRLGVRYLLAAPDAQLPPPLERVFADADGSVWEQPRVRARVFLEGGRFSGPLAISRLDSSWITARARLGHGQRLGSSVYQDGGWRVLVNGTASSPEVEQGVFLAADLPAGEERVDLLYGRRGFCGDAWWRRWGWRWERRSSFVLQPQLSRRRLQRLDHVLDVLVERQADLLGAVVDVLAVDAAGEGLLFQPLLHRGEVDVGERLAGLDQGHGGDEAGELVAGVEGLGEAGLARRAGVGRVAQDGRAHDLGVPLGGEDLDPAVGVVLLVGPALVVEVVEQAGEAPELPRPRSRGGRSSAPRPRRPGRACAGPPFPCTRRGGSRPVRGWGGVRSRA